MSRNGHKLNIGRIIFYFGVITMGLGAEITLAATGYQTKKEEHSYTYDKIDAYVSNPEEVAMGLEPKYEVPEGYTLMIDSDGKYYGVRVNSNVKQYKKTN